MVEGKPSVKRRLGEYLARRGSAPVGDAEWAEIRELFGRSSAGYLRRLLRESGVPLAPLVEGIRQSSFDDLERTLMAIEREYALARRAGDAARQRECRRVVIEAKDHARLSLRRAADETRATKAEMIAWMLVWLENPGAFPAWLRLRKTGTQKGQYKI